jgi:cytochrome c oxidase subunit 2
MEPDDHSSSAATVGASEGANLGLRGPAWVGARVSSGQPIPVAGTWEVVDHLGCHTSGELHAFGKGEITPDCPSCDQTTIWQLTHLAVTVAADHPDRVAPRVRAGAALPGGGLRRRGLWVVLMLVLTGPSACGGDPPSILEPGSKAAERVAGLWWVLFWISVVAVGVVTAFLLVAVRRRSRPDEDDDVDMRPVPWGGRFVVIAGIVVPGAVLAATFVVSLLVLDDLAAPSEDPALTVEVVGRNWWWEVRYPDGVVTANEIHIPVGEPVEVELPTADVIHSFWVPELQVKEDHMPGSENSLWLEADRPGRYRGQCAEFCGLQHANMRFQVEAQPADEFEAWLARQERPAAEPVTDAARRGQDVFVGSSCAGCHTVRGTPADGELGPDLTHLASRETIGAGVVELSESSLADFVADPQDDKPGASMPPTELSPEEVAAVVAYLMELE